MMRFTQALQIPVFYTLSKLQEIHDVTLSELQGLNSTQTESPLCKSLDRLRTEILWMCNSPHSDGRDVQH